jgi:hypothetical protein
MAAIVHGLPTQYAGCLTLTRVNLHGRDPLRETLQPLGTPEFVLLDAQQRELMRWFGVTEAREFDAVLTDLCN